MWKRDITHPMGGYVIDAEPETRVRDLTTEQRAEYDRLPAIFKREYLYRLDVEKRMEAVSRLPITRPTYIATADMPTFRTWKQNGCNND